MPELLWLLLEDDPEMRRKVWVGYDRAGTPRSAHVEQEVDDIIEMNAEAEKATQGVPFGDYNRVASVPLTFLEKTGLDQAIDARDRRYLSKILNDPDFARFRTSRGTV